MNVGGADDDAVCNARGGSCSGGAGDEHRACNVAHARELLLHVSRHCRDQEASSLATISRVHKSQISSLCLPVVKPHPPPLQSPEASTSMRREGGGALQVPWWNLTRALRMCPRHPRTLPLAQVNDSMVARSHVHTYTRSHDHLCGCASLSTQVNFNGCDCSSRCNP